MKKAILILLAFLLAACTPATPTPAATPSTANLDAEEIAVYAALLQTLYPNQTIVLMNQTATGPAGVGDTASTLEYALKEITGIDPETTTRFQERNEAASSLKTDMNLGVQYVLLSQEDMRKIFDVNQDGWQVFYGQYPDSPGITTISRAGFNNTLDQALIYIGTQSHWLAGAGYFILMKKVDGAWTIDQQVMTWIS